MIDLYVFSLGTSFINNYLKSKNILYIFQHTMHQKYLFNHTWHTYEIKNIHTQTKVYYLIL